MKNKLKTLLFSTSMCLTLVVACTDLEEIPLDGVSPQGGATSGSADFRSVLNEVGGICNDWARMLGIQEMTADGLAGPTRGGDWDDNAALRQIHAHTWAPDHPWIASTYNVLLTGIFKADLVLLDGTQSADHSKVKFLKAWFYYHMIDKFGQVPYRDSYDDLTQNASVYSRSEAFEVAKNLAEEALNSLPEKSNDGTEITKDAARFLLAQLYLNKAVFTSEMGSTTYNFEAADMTKVISYVNDMTSSLNTIGSANGDAYWKNFAPSNHESDEIIFSLKGILGGGSEDTGGPQYNWRMGMHYNQTPGGWNGPVITSEYYNYFLENGVSENEDPRATYFTDDIIDRLGNPVGIQRGQIYTPKKSEKVLDRKGNDLIFSPEVPLVVLDPVAIESAGYRPMKYIPDTDLDNPENDLVIYRYGAALLMRAEASLRGGTGADAQADIDALRSRVGLGSISATLENLYAESARELWLEGTRRTDMIRFGTFLNAKQLKPTESDTRYLLFPIPADGLINPNITQNPGY